MILSPQVQSILRDNQKLGIKLGTVSRLDVQHEEDYTVIPIHVTEDDGGIIRIYEDGMIMYCSHVETEGDAITMYDGTAEEYSVAAEVCKHCDAWYDKALEDWIE